MINNIYKTVVAINIQKFLRFLSPKRLFFVVLSCVYLPFTSAYAYVDAYADMLQKYTQANQKSQGVTFQGIDYPSWGNDPRHKQIVEDILKTNTNGFMSDAEKMAFWIDAYNILTIDLIVREQETETIKNLGSFLTTPWQKHKWTVNGQAVTLDNIEHDILRPMGDARVHAVIVCASLSCPDLPMQPMQADTLDAQLDTAMRTFLENPTKGTYVKDGKLFVSSIFKWFTEDFETASQKGKNAIHAYVQNTMDTTYPNNIAYIPYNWDLNKIQN